MAKDLYRQPRPIATPAISGNFQREASSFAGDQAMAGDLDGDFYREAFFLGLGIATDDGDFHFARFFHPQLAELLH